MQLSQTPTCIRGPACMQGFTVSLYIRRMLYIIATITCPGYGLETGTLRLQPNPNLT